MTSPVGIERKVLRLDGDVHAIYTMLTDIAASQRRLVDQSTTAWPGSRASSSR